MKTIATALLTASLVLAAPMAAEAKKVRHPIKKAHSTWVCPRPVAGMETHCFKVRVRR